METSEILNKSIINPEAWKHASIEELEKAISGHKKQIEDLRSNPGGDPETPAIIEGLEKDIKQLEDMLAGKKAS